MWYLNNKIKNHMYRDKNKFMELDKSIINNVIFVDH